MRIVFLLSMALVVGQACANAQTVETTAPTTQDRTYKLLREDEDWSFLRRICQSSNSVMREPYPSPQRESMLILALMGAGLLPRFACADLRCATLFSFRL